MSSSTLDSLVNIKDFEKEAQRILPRYALDYYRSGAGEELSLRRNREAFTKILLRPHALRDVSNRSMHTTVLGDRVASPIAIAPTAMQRMAHPDGECANAKAAASMGTVFTLSTLSTSSLEEVAEATPDGLRWFQLYIYNDRSVTRQLVERAEKAGYRALVLTVDAPMFGIRYADKRNKFSLPPHLRLANFEDVMHSEVKSQSGGSGINEYVGSLFDPKLSWNDITWLKSITSLPVIVKGILRPEDAILAANHGAAGIVVSNHGARQVDTVPATIEVLPSIATALSARACEVYLDGGITSGTDVFKAIALGAKMVFIGRPALWGLACGGEAGVRKVLYILCEELDVTMALAGCQTIAEIKQDLLAVTSNLFFHPNEFKSKI